MRRRLQIRDAAITVIWKSNAEFIREICAITLIQTLPCSKNSWSIQILITTGEPPIIVANHNLELFSNSSLVQTDQLISVLLQGSPAFL